MWYTKFNLIERKGKIKCPNCTKEFSEQMFYSLDSMLCNNCSKRLVFLRTLKFIYVINLDESSKLFIVMYNYLINESPKDVTSELKEIFNLFEGEGAPAVP